MTHISGEKNRLLIEWGKQAGIYLAKHETFATERLPVAHADYKESLFFSPIVSHLDYCNLILYGIAEKELTKMQRN